jgi:hypothetical protein
MAWALLSLAVMPRLAALALALAATGCSLYFPGGDDTPDTYNLDGGSPDADLGLRNPDNLRCEAFGRPGECDPACGPCPLADSADQAPLPPWGECGGRCDTLPEAACLVDVECRAAYDFNYYTGAGPCTAFQPFLGCFSLSRWNQPGQCEGLDAWSCSGRPDCVALHSEVCDPSGVCWPQFVECTSENRAAPAGP